jgi:hypothetical protein
MANKFKVKSLTLRENMLKVKLVLVSNESELDMTFKLNEETELLHNADAFAAIVADYAETALGE